MLRTNIIPTIFVPQDLEDPVTTHFFSYKIRRFVVYNIIFNVNKFT